MQLDLSISEKPVIELTVSQRPIKIEYMEGDIFNPNGLVLNARYSDGTYGAIGCGYSVVDEFHPVSSDTPILVSFEGVMTEVAIRINPIKRLYAGCSSPSSTLVYSYDITESVYSTDVMDLRLHPYSGGFSFSYLIGTVGIGSLSIPLELRIDSHGRRVLPIGVLGERLTGTPERYTYSNGLGNVVFRSKVASLDLGEHDFDEMENVNYRVCRDGVIEFEADGTRHKLNHIYKSNSSYSLSSVSTGLPRDYRAKANSELNQCQETFDQYVSVVKRFRLFCLQGGSQYPKSLEECNCENFLDALDYFISRAKQAYSDYDQYCYLVVLQEGLDDIPMGNGLADIYQASRENVLELLEQYREKLYPLSERIDSLSYSEPVAYLNDGSHVKAFNSKGSICSIYDGHGNCLTISYKDGLPDSIDLNGECEAKISYDNGLLRSVSMKSGSKVNFEYSDEKLISLCSNTSSVAIAYENNYVTSISCESEVFISANCSEFSCNFTVEGPGIAQITASVSNSGAIGMVNINGILTKITSSGGRLVKYEKLDSFEKTLDYLVFSEDASGSYVRQAQRDKLGRLPFDTIHPDTIESYLNNGINLKQVRDVFGRVINEEYSNFVSPLFDFVAVSNCYVEQLLTSSTTIYKKLGEVVRTVERNFEYDVEGRLLSEHVDDDGDEISYAYSYDSNSFQTSIMQKQGGLTWKIDENRMVSDKYGRPLENEYIKYSYIGRQPGCILDKKTQLETYFGYDDCNRLDNISFNGLLGEHSTRRLEYDSSGNVSSIKDGFDSISFNRGHLFREILLAGHGHRMEIDEDDGYRITRSFEHSSEIVTKANDKTSLVIRDGVVIYREDYGIDGNLVQSVDYTTGEQNYYYVDEYSRLVSVMHRDGEGETFEYDTQNRLINHSVGQVVQNYGYNDNGDLEYISGSNLRIEYSNDLERLEHRKRVYLAGNQIDDVTLTASVRNGCLSNLTSKYTSRLETLYFEYDNADKISSVFADGRKVKEYKYDGFGRIIVEEDIGKSSTTSIQYDCRGNIISRVVKNPFTGQVLDNHSMFYDGNVLVSIDGQTVDNDQFGRPILYRGMHICWSCDRPASIGENIFEYDAFGRRVSKNGQRICYDSKGRLISVGSRISFAYEDDLALLITIDGISFYLERNPFGDVTGLINSEGDVVARYSYDLFGKPNVLNPDGTMNENPSFIGNINPIRYRGYYYDVETGLYWLSSRYYDPEIGRFISPDNVDYLDPTSINGLNLYAYCNNDPVNYCDPSGHLPQWANWLIGGAVILGLGIATVFTGGAAGAILGAAFYGAVTGAVGGAIVGGIVGGITDGWDGVLDGASSGFMWGAISGAVTGALTSGINIATGSVQIVGSAQKTGSLFHQFASNVQAGKMSLAVGKYSEIHLNRSKGLGIKGFRPDVTGVTKNGLRVVEVVSSSQTYLSQVEKVGRMMSLYSHISSGLTVDAIRFITSWFIF